MSGSTASNLPTPISPPKVCLTVAGCLIHEGKVLLVKHKKLGFWLNPGGHVEDGEMPHQAAEREFWEETGVKVRALDISGLVATDDSEYVPTPFATNLHWVSQENYQARLKNPENYQPQQQWKKGCEQHVCLEYLVEPVGSVAYFANIEESDGIGWFAAEDMATLETQDNIRKEVARAFELRSGK